MDANETLNLAYNYVQYTGEHIFLTGKAGTGKTTFLRHLKDSVNKQMVVLAPTGVAAINAGGMTIHSFFQLPFGPYIATKETEKRDSDTKAVHKLRKEKIALIRSLNLLIIDEISMVRADLLDAINDMLCRYRRDSRPFGGLQMLMIGDVQQLAPVAKDEEWALLRTEYETPYFFSSKALRKTHYITISLNYVFRQSDKLFLDLLNKVRENSLDKQSLEKLNTRYIPDFSPKEKEGYIILTTHNYQAQEINEQKLSEIKTPTYTYFAEINGTFPENSYPTNQELILKKGAQVMFVKNDTSGEKRFYNGKIGRITQLSDSYIYVLPEGEQEEILVEKEEWMNTKYTLDPDTKDISETVEGVFLQYPLKLAWAITIHKSQGLTFEHAIIDAAGAFAYGQVYVALSRCKTLEGMVLKRPISHMAIKKDLSVQEFNNSIQEHPVSEKDLSLAQRDYYLTLVTEVFDFRELLSCLQKWNNLCQEYLRALYPEYCSQTAKASIACFSEITEIGKHFQQQIQTLILSSSDYEKDEKIKERIHKACVYFRNKMEQYLKPLSVHPLPDMDNKDARKAIEEYFHRFRQEMFLKEAFIKDALAEFSIASHLKTRAKTMAEMENLLSKKQRSPKKETKKKEQELSGDIPHPVLYRMLTQWRAQEAKEMEVPAYVILAQSAVLGIVKDLPRDKKDLKQIRGIGPKTIDKYAGIILEMVDNYLEFIQTGKTE